MKVKGAIKQVLKAWVLLKIPIFSAEFMLLISHSWCRKFPILAARYTNGGRPPGPFASFLNALVSILRNFSQFICLFDFSRGSPSLLNCANLAFSSKKPFCFHFYV